MSKREKIDGLAMNETFEGLPNSMSAKFDGFLRWSLHLLRWSRIRLRRAKRPKLQFALLLSDLSSLEMERVQLVVDGGWRSRARRWRIEEQRSSMADEGAELIVAGDGDGGTTRRRWRWRIGSSSSVRRRRRT
ncbi:hypothetical protein Dimus_024863, partial [Dionaea muscipula]